MGSNFVNIGTDILQAYLGGKQVAMQKQKQLQDAQQFQQKREDEANQLKEQVKMHQDSLKNAMDIHSATQKAEDARMKVRNAIEKAKIKSGMIKDFNMEGGFPQEEALPDNGPTINNLTAPTIRRNVANYQPFANIPEMADINIGGNEVAPVSRMDRIAQENIKARAADREDQQLARKESLEAQIQSRKDIADEANKTRLMIAGMVQASKSGQGTSQIDPEAKALVDQQFLTGELNMDDFNKLHSVTKEGRDNELGRMLKAGGRPLLKKESEGLDALVQSKDLFNRMIDYSKKVNVSSLIPWSDQRGELEIIKSGIGKLRDVLGGKGLGVLSEPDLQRLLLSVANVFNSKSSVEEKIKNLREIQNNTFQRLLKRFPSKQQEILKARWAPDILLDGGDSSTPMTGASNLPSNLEIIRKVSH